MKINNIVQQYIDNLVSSYPLITSIWLIGSRANNSYRDDSDWDLLLFANEKTLEELRENNSFNKADIDILVVFDGDKFEGPWPDNKGIKSGELASWKWHQVSDNEATYRSVKYKSEEEWYKEKHFECKTLKAVKIWPKE